MIAPTMIHARIHEALKDFDRPLDESIAACSPPFALPPGGGAAQPVLLPAGGFRPGRRHELLPRHRTVDHDERDEPWRL